MDTFIGPVRLVPTPATAHSPAAAARSRSRACPAESPAFASRLRPPALAGGTAARALGQERRHTVDSTDEQRTNDTNNGVHNANNDVHHNANNDDSELPLGARVAHSLLDAERILLGGSQRMGVGGEGVGGAERTNVDVLELVLELRPEALQRRRVRAAAGR